MPNPIPLIIFLISLIFVAQSIGYYERNIARNAYWLLANNLHRLNGTHEKFWSIVDNDKMTKKEVLLELGKWVNDKGAYMVVSFLN